MITLWFAAWRWHLTIQLHTSIANRQPTINHKITNTLWLAWRCHNICNNFFYFADMYAESINQQKTFVGKRVSLIQIETAAVTWRHVPSQSNPADLISRGVEPTALSTSTLWWKGPQWLVQQQSRWPTTEVNTPTDNLEVRYVHVAVLHPEDITQSFSKLNRLIRVGGRW